MAIFKILKGKTNRLQSTKLKDEKTLQKLFEENLETVLNISFLASEYSTSFGGRIDTLGIDKNGAPVIIEYKRNQNDNVINQGLSYLRWLLDHKADFERLCQKKGVDIEIDWQSPRVICIAENYSKFDMDTADILPINIELLKYGVYNGDILHLDTESYQKVKIPTASIIKKAKQKKAQELNLQVSYSLDDHVKTANNKIKGIFFNLREKILALDKNISEEPKSKYIAYKLATNFVDVVILRGTLKLFLNLRSGQLQDPHNLARDLTKPKHIGHWGNGDYEVKVTNAKDIENVFELIKQSYDANK
jgi:predicted transport protein